MEVEIVTTKKKLTKSIINQMRRPSLETMKNGDVLGYLIGIVKNVPRAFLIHNDGKYFVLESNWTKGETSVYRSIGKWSQAKRFESAAMCDDWWAVFKAVGEKAKDQIYI